MIRPQTQLRLIALLYALFATLWLFYIGVIWWLSQTSPSASLTAAAVAQQSAVIPVAGIQAIGAGVLSVLSLRFLKLSRSLQTATVIAALFLGLFLISSAVRISLAQLHLYRQPDPVWPLLVTLGVSWGLVVVFSLCACLLWRQLNAADGRVRT